MDHVSRPAAKEWGILGKLMFMFAFRHKHTIAFVFSIVLFTRKTNTVPDSAVFHKCVHIVLPYIFLGLVADNGAVGQPSAFIHTLAI